MRDKHQLDGNGKAGYQPLISRPNQFDDLLTTEQTPAKRSGESSGSILPERIDFESLFTVMARSALRDANAEPRVEPNQKEAKEKQDPTDAKEKEREELQKKLETDFRITVAKEGEKVTYFGKESTCRKPTLKELEAVKEAMYRGQPSQLISDGKTLRLEFINDKVLPGATAFRMPGRLVFQSGVKDLKPMHKDSDVYRGPGGVEDSLVATILHELGHNTQGRVDPRFDALSSNSPGQAKRGEALGFRKIADEKTGEVIWILEGSKKSDGKNQDLFRLLPGDPCNWLRCNEKGQVLEEEKNGKRAVVERVNSCDMPGRTKYPFPTTYHANPTETEAEALTCLRLGGASLQMLIGECPQVYQAARDLDRQDIMKTYGSLADDKNEPKYVRNKNGYLVANSEEARKAMKEFEERSRTKRDK